MRGIQSFLRRSRGAEIDSPASTAPSLPPTLGWIVAKGGITANDVLSSGLELNTIRLLGQILPGIPVVRLPQDHPRFPGMPVVIFPGNVGDDQALAEVCRRLYGTPNAQNPASQHA